LKSLKGATRKKGQDVGMVSRIRQHQSREIVKSVKERRQSLICQTAVKPKTTTRGRSRVTRQTRLAIQEFSYVDDLAVRDTREVFVQRINVVEDFFQAEIALSSTWHHIGYRL
jgi:hypothetical protein